MLDVRWAPSLLPKVLVHFEHRALLRMYFGRHWFCDWRSPEIQRAMQGVEGEFGNLDFVKVSLTAR